MTPLPILLFGLHPVTAVGTDLLYAAVTKTGNVDWSVAALLAAGSIPATVMTIWVLSLMPREDPSTASIISISTGVALIIAAVAIFFAAVYGTMPWRVPTIPREPATLAQSRWSSVL